MRRAAQRGLGYVFPNPAYFVNQYGRGEWAVQTRHTAIHFVLTQYYQIQVGRKKRASTISPVVVNSKNSEVKYASVAGWISSEGFVSGGRMRGRFVVKIGVISTVSRKKALDVCSVLKSLGYNPYVCSSTHKNPYTSKPITHYSVVVHRRHEVIQLLFQVFPYMLKLTRLDKWVNLLRKLDFYKGVRLRSSLFPALLRRAAIVISGSTYRYLHILVKMADNYGIKEERWGGVKHWTKSYKLTSVPLPIIVECCQALNEDYFKYIPKEFSPLLYFHGVISYDKLLKMRTIKPIIDLRKTLEKR